MDKTTYDYQPGRGKLFVNARKPSESAPDYSGRFKLPDGRTMRIVGWSNGNHINLKVEYQDEIKASYEPTTVAPVVDGEEPF